MAKLFFMSQPVSPVDLNKNNTCYSLNFLVYAQLKLYHQFAKHFPNDFEHILLFRFKYSAF